MKFNLIFAVFLFTLILGCEKDEATLVSTPPCLQQYIHPDWKNHHFKSEFTFQLPDGYFSHTSIFEGPTFFAFSSDTSVFMRYSFCGALQCYEFGDILVDAQPDSIQSFDPLGGQPMLDQRLEICDSLMTTGLFYYVLGNICVGNLYQLHEGNFKESLAVFFSRTDLDEVQTIMQTIRRK